MRIDNYARVQDFARRQDDLNGLPDEMSQARHPRTTWALRKDSVDVPACVNGKKGEAFAGEAKEAASLDIAEERVFGKHWQNPYIVARKP